MTHGDVEVRRLSLGPLQSNCYLLFASDSDGALVVDPGAEPDRVSEALEAAGRPPEAILLTHAHLDHVGGIAGLKARHDVPIYLHPEDLPLYRGAADQAAAFGLHVEAPPEPEERLRDGQRLRLASIPLEVRHAPGHSPGGVVFVGDGFALVGDCVFAGSVGRTDLPGGDGATLLRSIRERILDLPEGTTLYTGHGPETSVGEEASRNPFLTGAYRWGG